MPAEQLDHGRDVVQVRNVADRHRTVGEQRARQDGQRRVLGAGNAHLAVERHAAAYLQFVHASASLSASAGGRQARCHSAGVYASIDSAWISRPMRAPSAA